MERKLNIQEKKIDEQVFHIIANYEGTDTCTAVVKLKPGSLSLQWIETNERYQHKGIASVILNYLSAKCDSENRDMMINAVDEDLLNSFYFRWFSKRADPTDSNPDLVKEKFESFLIDDSSNRITIIQEDLLWDVASCSYSYN